jgi:hypothetical protein
MGSPHEPLLRANATGGELLDSAIVTPRFVVAGCVSAVTVGSLLSLLPVKGIVSALGIFPAAAFYILQAVFAGALVALLFGAPPEARSWRRLFATALVLGPAWVWVAPAVLLDYHESEWALLLAGIGAATLAICIRPFAMAATPGEDASPPPPNPREPFTGPLQPIPWDWHGLAIAVCGAAAFAAWELDANELACGLAVACAFLFAWQWAGALQQHLPSWIVRQREWRRLLRATVPALMITMMVLAIASHRNKGGAIDSTVNAARETNPDNAAHAQNANSPGAGFDGYQSIILWPEPPKKDIVAPIPLASLLPATRMKRPLIIRFTGAYWYFQPPQTGPGRRAHLARGSPLEASIHSTDFLPVTMEAHQNLSAAIRLARLRGIDVVVENRDNRPGRIAIGVALSDSTAPGSPSIYLGESPILSAEPDRFSVKSAPVEETLHFTVPSRPALRKFDELTLIVFPDASRMQLGAKIAIDEFDFLPR